MWFVSGNNLEMTEGDFGVKIPFAIEGTNLTSSDSIKLTIKSHRNGRVLIEKTFSNIEHNTIQFELTESESSILPVGLYVYRLDWYQNSVFMYNIIPFAQFKVVEKA